jgi:hypothetical protein
MRRMNVGTYFFPWYNQQRWSEAPRPFTPMIGEYNSAHPDVISWQIDQIIAAAIDYVIFEIVPQHDWCFRTSRDAIEIAVEQLQSRDLCWSFLIDSTINPGPKSAVHDVLELIDYIEGAGWTKAIVTGPKGRPMLFHFAPYPDHASQISLILENRYEMVYPLYIPHWGKVDPCLTLPVFSPHTRGAAKRGVTVFDELMPKRYIAFWQSTEELLLYDGICSIEPGYDDSLLHRDPQLAPVVKRRQGQHYRKRIKQAVATGADHILIYSWNEYFEGSTIEPTREYGTFYVDLTRRTIEELE